MRAASPAAAAIRRFRSQHPLRAGSLIVTIFGDSLAPRGGAITLASLIALASPFGLGERLVRTSAARLAADGWLASRRLGRLSEYRLSAQGRRRFADATARIYSGPAERWDGAWTLVLLGRGDPPRRRQLRELLHWKGFGELAAGTLAHPAVTPAQTREYLAMSGCPKPPILLKARVVAPADPGELVRHGWRLGELAVRYARFIGDFEPVLAALDARDGLEPADAFAVRTLLIHEYRKIHLRDPLLPHALLPADWPGAAAYELCRRIYERVTAAAERHLSSAAARLDGPLPEPDIEVRRRFPPLLG